MRLKSKVAFVAYAFILLTVCAYTAVHASGAVETKKEVYIGCNVIETERGVRVVAVTPGESAGKAGLLVDDVITQVNGTGISGFKQFLSVTRNLKPRSGAKFTIERGGQTRQLSLSPNQREVPADIDFTPPRKVGELLSTNQKVSMMIIVGDVTYAAGPLTNAAEWQAGIRNEIQSAAERFYFAYSGYPNFKIVDRSRTEEILKELRFSMSGVISDDFRAEVGKMTGATHIYHVAFSRFSAFEGAGYDDVTTGRLINIETGELVGSGRVSNKWKYNNDGGR